MHALKKFALNNIKHRASNFSIGGLIDLALLTNKRIALSVSQNQYIELLGTYGLLLNHQKVVLIGDKRTKERSPTGFYSIYDRLMDKFSLNIHSNLNGVYLLIYVRSLKEVSYQETINVVVLSPNMGFTETTQHLKKVGYQQVAQVNEVKQFCIKGGLVDFYSPVYQHPIRACFYDTLATFVFYNLSTGLLKKGGLKKVFLNKQTDKSTSISIESVLEKQTFTKVSSASCSSQKIEKNIKEVSESFFNKKDQAVQYLEEIQFSAYQTNNQIYAPNIYKNIKTPYKDKINFISGFEKGDFVCHEDFGVGQLMGFSGLIEDVEDFIKIKYLDGTINLSVKKLFKLSFVSRETDTKQSLGSLNKKGFWKRKKDSIQKNAEKYVDNLVNIYTNKSVDVRPPFVFGGDLEVSFLKAFKYTETKDQEVVWKELKEDLEGPFPMSRLLCGDVGFGKTELAIRAVFRVAINGGQSVVLCPTSILVNQHFRVFLERLSPFGVNVASLVGGSGLAQKTKIKTGWVEKKLDVLISTSAALYDDVFIKFASFFVIDEEHRFGVKQKEVLVNKFVNKDVLFMSATPIPRTLHLSLSGIYNISTLSTPPCLRKPINTIVSYFSDKLIKQSIYFELSRGGQVFYLHNKIKSIASIKLFLLKLCPVVKIAVVHSRLDKKKIKKTIVDFIDKKYNLLLCSSIIASGLDIPNANTIIVDNSHLFGLSQLHQIRGRVGRGESQAFAYLLIPNKKTLTVSGQKRLKTIELNSSLGSGYALSKADLEIRGGGAVFGYKQSGSIYDTGYEYYSKVVSRCFEQKTKKTNISAVDSFNYNVLFVCCFDERYIPLGYERLRVYRELSGLYTVEAISVFKEKLTQVYGKLSQEGTNLLYMRVVSVLCGSLNVSNLLYKKDGLVLFFNNNFIGVDYLVKFLELYKTKFSVLGFAFSVVNETTNITIRFNHNRVVDGFFLKGFIRGFDVFFKK